LELALKVIMEEADQLIQFQEDKIQAVAVVVWAEQEEIQLNTQMEGLQEELQEMVE
jgi:hypothetical protein